MCRLFGRFLYPQRERSELGAERRPRREQYTHRLENDDDERPDFSRGRHGAR